jgi:hypothetical protein
MEACDKTLGGISRHSVAREKEKIGGNPLEDFK